MKITFVANYDITYVRFRNTLINKLENAGHYMDLLCLSDCPKDGFPSEANPKQSRVEYLGGHPSQKSLKSFAKMLWLLIGGLRRSKPDLIFAQNAASIILAGTAKRLMRKKTPFVALIEGLGRGFDGQTKRLWQFSLNAADQIIFLNNSDKETLYQAGILPPAAAISTVNGIGIDISKFPALPMPETKPNILMIGRLIGTKHALDFCMAAQICKQADVNASFTLIYEPQTGADAPHPDVLLPFAECVNLIEGPVDVRGYLRDCNLLCLPSENEGFPVVVMEAAASGRAALVSDHPTLTNAITAQTGWIARLGDPADLAEKMTSILSDGSYVSKGIAARARAEVEFSKDQKDKEILSSVVPWLELE